MPPSGTHPLHGVPSPTHIISTKRAEAQCKDSGAVQWHLSTMQKHLAAHPPHRVFRSEGLCTRHSRVCRTLSAPMPPLSILRRVNCGLRFVNRCLWLHGRDLWFRGGSLPRHHRRPHPGVPVFQHFHLAFGGVETELGLVKPVCNSRMPACLRCASAHGRRLTFAEDAPQWHRSGRIPESVAPRPVRY
jgi:hypothetical protein